MQTLWMLLASLLFASMGVCVKLGSAQFSPAELVFWRGFIALALVYGFILLTGRSIATQHWSAHLSRSMAGLVSLILYFFAISSVPLATAVTLNYTAPLFLAVLLAIWGREALNRKLVMAVVLGFCGVVLLLKPTLRSDQWLGGLSGLVSGMTASVAYFQLRQLGALGEPEWRTVFYFSLVSSLGGLPWVLLGSAFHQTNLRGVLLMLGVGGFGALAQLAMTRAYRYGKTLASANLGYATVVFSSLFAMVLWQEVLPWTSWLAIGLIILSGVLASLLSRNKKPVPPDLMDEVEA